MRFNPHLELVLEVTYDFAGCSVGLACFNPHLELVLEVTQTKMSGTS